MVRVYGDLRSGNCLKVKWVLDRTRRAYEWVPVDIMAGESRTPDFLALNPAGQVPAVVLEDGRPLAQSNAIVLHFAEGTDLVPRDSYARAQMLEWLFWEQYSHEPYIAVRRFQMLYQGREAADLDPKLEERGLQALARMEAQLGEADWLAGGDSASCADLCLLAYTRMAGDGGFELGAFPAVAGWIARTEAALDIAPLSKTSMAVRDGAPVRAGL